MTHENHKVFCENNFGSIYWISHGKKLIHNERFIIFWPHMLQKERERAEELSIQNDDEFSSKRMNKI